ncbi:hypothetical protein DV704_11490 [Meiothermus sp. QL-1]|uniref:hypothetical protein n=1 Tax=Meiothermus sp. QL-1 TaxID=2058095 RepID=UPI000E0C6332|nr:hypothetical protein [Meiothermus sp. QL-1]RDI94606.1 hypothetical protein DV704_11490 [Meiothermus sp. QL-1]
MALKNPNPRAVQEARRGLLWALLLSLAILAGIVALLAGLTLLRLGPHAATLLSGEPATLAPGLQANPILLQVSLGAFAVSTGLLLALVWTMRQLRQRWSQTVPEPNKKRKKQK